MRFVFVLATLCISAFAVPQTVNLSKSKNSVEFLAVGKPAAIQIAGKLKEGSSLSGTLTIDGAAVKGEASLPLAGLDTGIELRNAHMKEKYLEVQKFPKAVITLTQLTLPGVVTAPSFSADKIPFQGTLLLHGVTQPIAGTVKAKKQEKELELLFDFKVSLGEFGIEIPSYLGIQVTQAVLTTVKVSTLLQ